MQGEGGLATSPATTSSSPGWCCFLGFFFFMCGHLGVHAADPQMCCFGGQTPGQAAAPEEGVAGQGSRAKVTPQRLGLPGGMLGAAPLPWEASVELSTHKLLSKAGLGAL